MKYISTAIFLLTALTLNSCNGGEEKKGDAEFLFEPYSNNGTINCDSVYTYTEYPAWVDSFYGGTGYLTFILTDNCDTKDSRLNITSSYNLIDKTIRIKDGTTFVGSFETSFNLTANTFEFLCEGIDGNCSYRVKTDHFYYYSQPNDTLDEVSYGCSLQTNLVLIYYNDTQIEIPVTVIVTEKCNNGTARVVTRSQLSLMDNLIIPVVQIPTTRKIDVKPGELVFLEYNGEGGNIKYKLVLP